MKYLLGIYSLLFLFAVVFSACSSQTIITCKSVTETPSNGSLVQVSCVTPSPSLAPSILPSTKPTVSPSPKPTPTSKPSASPTAKPTIAPTLAPTPTIAPTIAPTATPSPTLAPTATPTATPSVSPTLVPATPSPSPVPTPVPTPSATPISVGDQLALAALAENFNSAMAPTDFLVENAYSYRVYQRPDNSYFVVIYGQPNSSINVSAVPPATLAFVRNGANPTQANFLGIQPGATAWFSLDATGYLAVEYSGPSILPSASPVPTTAPTQTPTLVPTPVPVIPTATPTTTPTMVPSVSPTGFAHYSSLSKNVPGAGAYNYYPKSVFWKPIPANAQFVSATQSAAWNALQSPSNFDPFTVSENGSSVNDGSDPTTYTFNDGNNYTLNCSATSYSAYECTNSNAVYAGLRNMNGANVNFPAGLIAQGGSDHHVVNINTASNVEDDIWLGSPVPTSNNTIWKVGGAGECNLLGDGTACSGSYATNMAGSMGLIRPEDLNYCINSANASCTLPYALAMATKCNSSSYQYPASTSDGQCGAGLGTSATRMPEGSRGCLNMTDAQINEGSYSTYEKVIYRTIDCSHFGVIIRDTSWYGAQGFAFQEQGSQAYTAFGMTDPWTSIATSAGISKQNGTDYVFNFNLKSPPMIWCANTKNDGLCD